MNKKQILFVYIPCTLIVLLLFASFLYEFGFKNQVKPEMIKYDDHGEFAGRAPFPPSLLQPIGTDRNANDLGLRLLEGAKYTLLFAVGAAILRIVAGGIGGSFFSFLPKTVQSMAKPFFIPYQYVPSFILVFVLIWPMELIKDDIGYTPMIIYQFLVIVFVGIIPVMLLMSSEIQQTLKEPYIQVSYHLGASNKHIMFKHVLPVLRKRIFILFFQQIIQVLLLLIYLGVFELFIGGDKPGGIFGDEESSRSLSQSGEWAGMIGQSKFDLMTAPWIVLGPGVAFILLILLLNIVLNYLLYHEK
jgi:peptide/nickel transport system permease protein